MSALIALLISAAVAACFVTFLRHREERQRPGQKASARPSDVNTASPGQPEEREPLDRKAFVRRSAVSFSAAVIVGGIILLIVVVWLFAKAISGISGCFNC